MKLLLGLLLVCTVGSVLVVGALVQMLIQLLPLLVLFGAVVLAVQLLGGRTVAPPAAGGPARLAPRAYGPRPPLGVEPPRPMGRVPDAANGWVLMPVWVGPPPKQTGPPVIDAEVIEDDDRG